jgi:ATP-dependent Zn protease
MKFSVFGFFGRTKVTRRTREAAMAAFAKSWRRGVMTEGACNFLPANAYHEAGHTIVAWALGLHVDSITIRDDRPGENAKTASADGLPLVDQIAVEAAGREAGLLFGHPLPDWASGADRRVIINLLLASKIPEPEIPTCAPLLAGKERAQHVLTKHAPDVHKLAARLMECRHMNADEFKVLMEKANR